MRRMRFFLFALVYITSFCPVFGQVYFHPPKLISVQLAWSPPDTLENYAYQVKIFTRTGLCDSGIVQDTTTQVFFPKTYLLDSLFAEVRTVKASGAVSSPSVRVGCIPEVVSMDFHKDNKKRVDIEDFEALYSRYKRLLGRTLYKEVNK